MKTIVVRKSVDFLNREGSSPSIPKRRRMPVQRSDPQGPFRALRSPGGGMVDTIDSKSIAFRCVEVQALCRAMKTCGFAKSVLGPPKGFVPQGAIPQGANQKGYFRRLFCISYKIDFLK